MKHRMFPFSRLSSKHTASSPPEDRSRYYDFLDTPVLYRPESPLTERPQLSPETMGKLRCACMLLFHHMKTGQPSGLFQPEEATGDGFDTQSQLTQHIWNETQNHDHYLSQTDETFKKEKYDSGVELGVSSPETNERRKTNPAVNLKGPRVSRVFADYRQDESATDTGFSRLYAWESDQDSEREIDKDSIRDIQQGLVDVSLSSAGKDSSASEESSDHLTTSGIELNTIPQDEGVCNMSRAESESADSQKMDVWTDPSNPTVPCRFPSLSRPKSLSKRGDRAREVRLHREAGKSTQSQEGEGVAIIIDVDGEERVISAAEERQRRLDLQNAVMEKMSTGVITAAEDKERQLQLQRAVMEKMSSGVIGTAGTSNVGGHQEKTAGVGDYSLWPSMRTEVVAPLAPGLQIGSRLEGRKSPGPFPNVDQDTTHKKSGLRRKFSVLGLAKKKPAPVTASFG